jgi:hypothetical protein
MAVFEETPSLLQNFIMTKTEKKKVKIQPALPLSHGECQAFCTFRELQKQKKLHRSSQLGHQNSVGTAENAKPFADIESRRNRKQESALASRAIMAVGGILGAGILLLHFHAFRFFYTFGAQEVPNLEEPEKG